MSWGLRLLPPYTRALIARYFFATFPIIEKKVVVYWKLHYVATRKSETERLALRSMRLLEHEWSGEAGEVDEVRYALEALRGRERRERHE